MTELLRITAGETLRNNVGGCVKITQDVIGIGNSQQIHHSRRGSRRGRIQHTRCLWWGAEGSIPCAGRDRDLCGQRVVAWVKGARWCPVQIKTGCLCERSTRNIVADIDTAPRSSVELQRCWRYLRNIVGKGPGFGVGGSGRILSRSFVDRFRPSFPGGYCLRSCIRPFRGSPIGQHSRRTM